MKITNLKEFLAYTMSLANANNAILLTEDIVDTLMGVSFVAAVPCPCVITPTIAKYILKEYNTKNRKETKSTVCSYSKQMTEDTWCLNGETIIFGQGLLADGQHRLMSAANANFPIISCISCGVEDSVIPTMDTGKNRSKGDVLSYTFPRFKKYTDVITQAKNNLNGHYNEHGASSTRTTAITNMDAVTFASEFEDLLDEVIEWYNPYKNTLRNLYSKQLSTRTLLGFIVSTIINGCSKEKVFAFAELFLTDDYNTTNLGKKIHTTINRTFDKSWTQADKYAILVKAWNDYIDGKIQSDTGGNYRRSKDVPTLMIG